MTGWIVLAIIVAAVILGVIAQKRGWVDFSDKHNSSGGGGGGMGALDEAYNPTRHEAQVELDRQTILPAPAPVAGDGDKGIFNGRVRIDLSESDRFRD
jgi:hypothetical protein